MILFMYLMLVLEGLYIYFPVTPSRCGCYGDFNASFGNAPWSIIWALMAPNGLYSCPCNCLGHLFDCVKWPLYLCQQCGHFVGGTWLIRLSMLPRWFKWDCPGKFGSSIPSLILSVKKLKCMFLLWRGITMKKLLILQGRTKVKRLWMNLMLKTYD